jgi:hypothetical protein
MTSVKTFFLRLVVTSVGLFPLLASAQSLTLSNTIWEGNVTLSGITLQKVQGGVVQPGPNLANASVTLPVEIWFWNNSNCGVVFRRDKWGLNPEEFSYVETEYDGFGNATNWLSIYRQGPKYVGGGSLSPTSSNSNGYESTTDRYTYNPSKKTGTFSQSTIYNRGNGSFSAGAVMTITGNFRLSNSNTLVPQNIVLSLTPNPVGRNSYRTSGRLTIRAGNFVRTVRQPSVETDAEPGFSSYYYSKE